MKKAKIISLIGVILVIIILIVFASTHKFKDSHLRVEGIRVKVSNALVVDGCTKQNDAYCLKNINVAGQKQKLEFNFLNFRPNGFPNSISAKINDKEFYHEDGLKIEENGSLDYKIFLNFKVIANKYIAFTFTNGTSGRTTTLYVIDLKGNIILKETKIDDDDMLIKDYTDFITYKDNTITLYATRVIEDVNYHGESICNAKGKDIVEAYYTYTLKNDKFIKKQTKTITVDDFIKSDTITCTDRE